MTSCSSISNSRSWGTHSSTIAAAFLPAAAALTAEIAITAAAEPTGHMGFTAAAESLQGTSRWYAEKWFENSDKRGPHDGLWRYFLHNAVCYADLDISCDLALPATPPPPMKPPPQSPPWFCRFSTLSKQFSTCLTDNHDVRNEMWGLLTSVSNYCLPTICDFW